MTEYGRKLTNKFGTTKQKDLFTKDRMIVAQAIYHLNNEVKKSIHISGNEIEGIVDSKLKSSLHSDSSSSLSHSSSPAFSSASLWAENEGEKDEGTKILVFEDTQHRTERIGLGLEDVTEDESDDEGEEATFMEELIGRERDGEADDETAKTKRNSLSENKDISKDTGVHLSLPKAAALQSGTQGLSIGGLNPYNMGQRFQGFNLQRTPISCGMCSRERNFCQIISGIFTRFPLPYGYSLVTPIPAGVCNITIVETKPSKNFFALRKKDGTYVLNGSWKIQAAGNYGISGTLFSYSPSDGTRGEKLEAPGPLIEPIDLMIIYQSPNPGIKYEYRVPIHDLSNQQSPSRILPVLPNHGSIANTFNINTPLPGQNKFPTNVGSVQNQGTSTHLSGGSFPVQNRGGTNVVFPKRGSSTLDTSKPIGSVNKWNTPFIPGMNRVAINPGTIQATGSQPGPTFGQGASSLYPPQSGSSGSQLFPVGSRTVSTSPDTGLNADRFPGVLNTDPRTSPSRGTFPEEKYGALPRTRFPSTTNSSVGVNRGGASLFSQRPVGGTGRATKSSPNEKRIHRTRHKHGSRDILPGPAVGGKGLSPITTSRHSGFPAAGHPFTTSTSSREQDNKEAPENKERKRRRRGRRKNGRKRGRKGRKKRFHWVFKGLTDCTRSCGGGNQTSVYSCVHRRKERTVADRFCAEAPVGERKVAPCNLNPCPASWVPGEWGPCSVTCGIGVQTRPLLCKQEMSPSLTMMVPEGACLSPKEGNTTQVCQIEECPSKEPKWKVGEWSECSAECGVGIRMRKVKCIVMGKEVLDDTCDSVTPKPHVEESCDMGSCAVNTWFFSKWSDKCSETCGGGVQDRVVTCLTTTKGVANDSCPADLRPETTRSCTETSGCGGQWFAGPWSDCSVSCGSGRENRLVKCLEERKSHWGIVDELNCRGDLKPSLSRECNLQPCHTEWFTSEWGECSSSCGNGFQKREVKCLDAVLRATPNCLNTTKPETVRSCGATTCLVTPPPHEQRGQSSSNSEEEGRTLKETKTDPFFFTPSLKGSKVDPIDVSREGGTQNYDQNKKILDSEPSASDDVTKNNERTNELEVIHKTGSALNVIPDKDAQGDQSVSDEDDEAGKEASNEEKKDKSKRKEIEDKKGEKRDFPTKDNPSCIDRIKNCHLVFRARLCRLKYYNKLCCLTCHGAKR